MGEWNDMLGRMDSDEFLEKSEHVAKYGIRSWIEKRLREEGIIVAKTLPLTTLEAILKRVQGGGPV